MTTSAQCPVCGSPQDQGLLDHACTTALERVLGEVPSLVAQLQITISKQARIGAGAGKGGLASERSNINWGAVQVLDDLTNTLTTWAKDVAGPGWKPEPRRMVFRAAAQPFRGPFCLDCEHPSCQRMRLVFTEPEDPAAELAAKVMLGRIPAIRRHPAVEELVDEITDAITQARRAIDRPQDKDFLGQCLVPGSGDEGEPITCFADIYARRGASHTVCKSCGITHEVFERRADLLDQASDRLFTVREAAQIIGSYGNMQITESTIRNYVSSGQIAYHGKVEGSSVIRLGDLMAVIAAHAAKPSGRKLKVATHHRAS